MAYQAKFKKINLKKLFTLLYGAMMLFLMALVCIVYLIFENYLEFEQSYEKRFESLLSAKQLQQNSDNLTRYCRSYVATGEKSWEKKYWDVLHSQQGKKEYITQETIAFQDKINELSFTKAELDKLEKIKISSRYLLQTEAKAFYAMEGIFADRAGQFTIKKYPDPILARRIMFDQDYMIHKVKMSIYIDDFFTLLQQRAQKSIDLHNQTGQRLFGLMIVLIFFITGLSIFSFLIIRIRIISHLKKLKESEEKYKIIFEKNNDAILLIDTHKFIDCNLSTLEMFGYQSKAQLLNAHPSSMSPEKQEDGQLSLKKFQKMIVIAYEKKIHSFEWLHKRANGDEFPVTICLTLIPYQNRSILHAVCRDLSLRKHAEQAFKDSEKRFELAMSVANDGIWDLNVRDDRIIFDTRYYTMQGYTENEYPNQHEEWAKRVHPDDLGRIQQAMSDFIAKINATYDVEFRFLCKNGRYLWIRSRGKIIDYDADNQPLRIVGTHADIDEHRKAKDKLHQSELLKKTILKNIPDLMWLKDVNGIYLACNPRIEKILGLKSTKIIGKSDFDLFTTKQAEHYREQDELVINMDNAYTSEIIHTDKVDKTTIYEMTCTSVKTDEGKLVGVLGTTYNVTKRKENEQALIDAQHRAETANRAKSEFLANMSHEIRTPMNAILGFTEILNRLETDAKKSHYLKVINTSGQALLDLINDILDLSRIESGKMELQYDTVSIGDLCAELEGLLTHKIHDKGLTFDCIIAQEIPKTLLLDAARLRQVLINLLGNAIKFTHQGGIKLAFSCQYPKDATQNYLDLCFSVSDTGIGIPKAQQENIFSSFEQVKGQKETLYGGTGLGLAITLQIIKLMQGNIHLESKENKGSTFQIQIPNIEIITTHQSALQLKNLINTQTLVFSPATVLIVDDVDYNREILDTYLSTWDFTLHFATNGQQAVDKAQEIMPDIILLDMKMPVMDGYEAATQLKQIKTTQHIPIIAVTAFALNNDEVVINQLCESYLRKPVNQNDLLAELIKFLPNTQSFADEATEIIDTVTPSSIDLKQAISLLPNELQANLKQALEQVDLAEMDILQQQVTQENTQLAHAIQHHIDEFQYEKLLTLFG